MTESAERRLDPSTEELVNSLAEIYPEIAKDAELRERVRGYFEPSRRSVTENNSSGLITVQVYTESWTNFYDAYIHGAARKAKISEKQIRSVLAVARTFAQREWDIDMAPTLKEALGQTKLPLRSTTPPSK